MDQKQIHNEFKVTDMMVTMHSVLSNRYAKKVTVINAIMFSGSIILVSLTFFDPVLLSYFSIKPEIARIVIGLFSILIFSLSIFLLVTDWSGKSMQHKEASHVLMGLKNEWREFDINPCGIDQKRLQEFSTKSRQMVNGLIPISDPLFIRLKHHHHKKVALSKLLSKYPGYPLLILRLKLWCRKNHE